MLTQILESARVRVAGLDRKEIEARAEASGPTRPLEAALAGDDLSIIAEVKRRSPSAGPLSVRLDPRHQAEVYALGGAAAISVLTEPEFFGGSIEDLQAVRSACDLPVLRKDFIIEPIQVLEARAAGADAVLLIVAALSNAQLDELLEVATASGLAALVEVHNEREAKRALNSNATIVGVNNRDLASFTVDLAICERLASLLTGDLIRVAESGIHTPAHARRVREAGYQAALIGEALVRSTDPAALLRTLTAE